MNPSEGLPRARDRGPAKHFHGRRQILAIFAQECLDAATYDAGTIFLVQGAPGAGKTALLAKCEELAVNAKWLAANIETNALHDINALRAYLGTRLRWLSDLEGLSISGFRAAWKNTRHIWEVLRRTARAQDGGGLLLILDEAQHLHGLSPEQAGSMRLILNQIHNGKLGAPVMLLAGGLGTSQGAFEKLGISRFEGDCLVNLGRLSTEAERAVLNDWLTKDGQAKGDATPWIDAITHETYGWPQNILSYVKAALSQLHKDNGRLTDSGLESVLRDGKVRRKAYYEGRTAGFDTEELQALTAALIGATPKNGVYKRAVLAKLAEYFGSREAARLFDLALHKGVLASRGKGYDVPIPSMRTWLEREHPPL